MISLEETWERKWGGIRKSPCEWAHCHRCSWTVPLQSCPSTPPADHGHLELSSWSETGWSSRSTTEWSNRSLPTNRERERLLNAFSFLANKNCACNNKQRESNSRTKDSFFLLFQSKIFTKLICELVFWIRQFLINSLNDLQIIIWLSLTWTEHGATLYPNK